MESVLRNREWKVHVKCFEEWPPGLWVAGCREVTAYDGQSGQLFKCIYFDILKI